jgi:putative ABC transport system substrate-binding protein
MSHCQQDAVKSLRHCRDCAGQGPHFSNGSRLMRRVIALIVLFVSIEQMASAQITLLVERGASTYQETAQSFEKNLGAPLSEKIEVDESGQLPASVIDRWRRTPPRLVIAIGTRAARAASDRLRNLPLLYCLTLRPNGDRLSGIDIGGMVLDADVPQQFENIRKLLPNLRRIGVVYDELNSGPLVKQARQRLAPGLQIVARNARTPREAEQEIQDFFSNVLGPGDAFWLLWDSVVANPATFRMLVELSLKYRVPLIVPARPFVEAGALISAGPNYEEAGRQLASMAQQVLAGRARPGEFRAVAASELTITINGEVARKLGVPIPRNLQADILAPTSVESGH